VYCLDYLFIIGVHMLYFLHFWREVSFSLPLDKSILDTVNWVYDQDFVTLFIDVVTFKVIMHFRR